MSVLCHSIIYNAPLGKIYNKITLCVTLLKGKYEVIVVKYMLIKFEMSHTLRIPNLYVATKNIVCKPIER